MSLQGPAAPASLAPVLVFALGNPSRGDDALGPTLAARLESANWPEVEVIVDFQLQVEHALDLAGRRLVIFVDAALDVERACEVRAIKPARDESHTSHALSPAAVLETFERITGQAAPEAHILAIRGQSFELGAPLSAIAIDAVESAWEMLRTLLRASLQGAR